MNKLLQNLFLVLFPFFPLLCWVAHFATATPVRVVLNLALLPVAFYFIAGSGKRLPRYLVFFALFTVYHIISSFLTNTIPADQGKIFFILADNNVFALALFVIIEHVKFSTGFIEKMNRNIFLIVIVSLAVSLVQVKNPNFFFNDSIDLSLYILEGDIRATSIYSWVTMNSGGITVPIMIAILLNYHETGSRKFIIVILSAIVIAFLTKARYVMISTIIAFSQLFLSGRVSSKKIVSIVFIFLLSFLFIIFIAGELGFNIEEVISSRILEKDTEMGSAKARITSYEVFVKVFPEHPWTGVGPDTRDDVKAMLGDVPLIHVGYLSYLYFYGIAGCLLLFGSIFYMFKMAWRVGKDYGFWGSFYGLITFCFANITLVYFNFSETGVVLILIYLRYYLSTFAEEQLEEEEEEGEDNPVPNHLMIVER